MVPCVSVKSLPISGSWNDPRAYGPMSMPAHSSPSTDESFKYFEKMYPPALAKRIMTASSRTSMVIL